MPKNQRVPNRLIHEKSPYLLQHAYNPVDWYPWGEEAFEKAKEEDKPIFLSIGYSTCHWCHVMERESFEDNEVAQLLNDHFVSIKVDREERPDLDHIYMTFCQVLTGQGGWPLTVFLTPDQKPFYAGTYFPKRKKYGRAGLMELLTHIKNQWAKEPDKIMEASQEIKNMVEENLERITSVELDKDIIDHTFKLLSGAFDSEYGGFGDAPKFPLPHYLFFLLRYWYHTGEKKSLYMVEKTLQAMYKGGIFDHIGFGFSRYSVDERWLIPHFEKMLYDNALLAIAYLEAYQVTDNTLYREVVENIFHYISNVMTSPEGAFYSAEDADSEGEEGKYYVWTMEEIEEILEQEEGKIYKEIYNITKRGNFDGKNLPNLINQDIEMVQNNRQLKYNLEEARKKLLHERKKRVAPHKDDKILTGWNGLMISALAYGGRVLKEKNYIDQAEKAMEFIMNHLVRKDGRLMARYRDGDTAHLGYIDDYAFIIWALIELYEATYQYKYIEKAIILMEETISLFWDKEEGGFYLYGKDGEQLILRPKEIYDGAIPSGNAVAFYNLIRLEKIMGREEYGQLVEEGIQYFSRRINQQPDAHLFMMINLMMKFYGMTEIKIVGPSSDYTMKKMIEEIEKRYLPFKTIVVYNGNEEMKYSNPLLKNIPVKGKTKAYICQGFSCREPVSELEELKGFLDGSGKR